MTHQERLSPVRPLWSAALLLMVLASLHAADVPHRRPNVLLIYSDDHGWADMGMQGVDPHIRTPHLDQLVHDGVRFTRGYVSAPQCVPSRAGVITGRYQQRFGVEDNNKGPLPLTEITIAERLKPAGYISGWVGKGHLDMGTAKGQPKANRVLREHMPHRQGFDEYFRGELRQFYASHDLQGRPFADAPHGVTDNRFRVEVQTEAALSFLDRRAGQPEQPWFLYLAWFAPHVPLESPEPWFSQTPRHLPIERRQALAMIAAMDEGLGRLRAKLRAIGQEEDTLIFFIGDNGAPVKPGAWDGSLNAPLVGEKGMLTDGGIRVPFVAAWPSHIPAGTVFQQPVINLDVAATAQALAGLPADESLDGVNLLPFLTGETRSPPHDALYWRWRSQAAVLEYPWKLIQLGMHERFLFDVTHPQGELAANNRLAQHPDIAARLEEKLQKWSATLQPPGPPEPRNSQDDSFYAAHVSQTAEQMPKSRGNRATGGVQGWIARNGKLVVQEGALRIVPEDEGNRIARPFLTHSGLDIAGPVSVTLHIRAKQGGPATFAWRTASEKDFVAENTQAFDWPTASTWQTVRAELPVQGRLIHLRILPAKGCQGLAVQSIELTDRAGVLHAFRFGSP